MNVDVADRLVSLGGLIPALAVGAKVDVLPLVHSKTSLHVAKAEQCKMHKRAHSTVAHQQISGGQQRVQSPHVGLLVRVERPSISIIRPLKASNSPSTLGTGKPHPFFWPVGCPKAFRRAGVSGVIVLEPSTRYGAAHTTGMWDHQWA